MTSPPFTRPPGDPGAVRAAAESMGSAAGTAASALSTFKSGTQTALRGWDSPVGADFAQLCGPANNRMSAAVTQVEGCAGLVRGYGDALLAAQDTIDALTAQWLAQQETIDSVDNAADPTGQQQADKSSAQSEQGRIESKAEDALADLRSIERRIAGHIDDGTSALVPAAAGMTPEQLYNRVMSAWGAADIGYSDFKNGLSAHSVYSSVQQIARARRAVRAYADANRASRLLNQTRNLALAQARVLISGGGAANRIPGQLGILARDIADARRVADSASELSATRYANFYRSVVPATRFARGLAGIGVVGSLYDLFANPMGETGVRRGISVGVDIIGAGAGATALAASAGLITLGPVGLGVVTAGLVIAGAWAAGTYIYDHWDDITAGVDTAVDWTGDRLEDAGEAIGDAADAVGDFVGGLF